MTVLYLYKRDSLIWQWHVQHNQNWLKLFLSMSRSIRFNVKRKVAHWHNIFPTPRNFRIPKIMIDFVVSNVEKRWSIIIILEFSQGNVFGHHTEDVVAELSVGRCPRYVNAAHTCSVGCSIVERGLLHSLRWHQRNLFDSAVYTFRDSPIFFKICGIAGFLCWEQ